MSSHVHNVTFDCADTYRLAQFWSQVTGWPMDPDDHPGDPEALVAPPDGEGLPMIFCQVPEAKTVKNRVHVCLYPNSGTTRDAEVTRLRGIGAGLVNDLRTPTARAGWSWQIPRATSSVSCAAPPSGLVTPDPPSDPPTRADHTIKRT